MEFDTSLDTAVFVDEEEEEEKKKKRPVSLTETVAQASEPEEIAAPPVGTADQDVEPEGTAQEFNEAQSISANIDKALTSASANRSKPSAEDVMMSTTNGRDYLSGMRELESELEQAEAEITQGVDNDKREERISHLIKTSIQAMAQMYAISKGVQTKLQLEPVGSAAARLRELDADANRKRRILKSRIGAAQGLLKDIYSHNVRSEGKAERKTMNIESKNAKTAERNAQIDANNEAKRRRLKKTITTQWLKQTSDKKKSIFLQSLGVPEDRANELAAVGWTNWGADPEGMQAEVDKYINDPKNIGSATKGLMLDEEGNAIPRRDEAPTPEPQEEPQEEPQAEAPSTTSRFSGMSTAELRQLISRHESSPVEIQKKNKALAEQVRIELNSRG